MEKNNGTKNYKNIIFKKYIRLISISKS